jgi:hypothetical protein
MQRKIKCLVKKLIKLNKNTIIYKNKENKIEIIKLKVENKLLIACMLRKPDKHKIIMNKIKKY